MKISNGLLCNKCSKPTLGIYKDEDGEYYFRCKSCEFIETIKPIINYCPACGAPYNEITWFIPSACRVCSRTFVD